MRQSKPAAADPEAQTAPPDSQMRVLARIPWDRLRPWLAAVAAAVLAAIIFAALRRLLKEVNYTDIKAVIAATPPAQLWLSLGATLLSYLALTGFDASGLRYAGATIKPRFIALTSFIAFALANTVGFGVFTGGAVRLRMYSAAGAEAAQIGQAIAFNAAAFGVGITVVGAAGLLWGANQVGPVVHLPHQLLQGVAVLILLPVAAFLGLCVRRRTWRLGTGMALPLPTGGLALRQLLISVLDLTASAAALWFLLPDTTVGFAGFVAFYSIGIALGIISHVPGGLGVFETVMLLAYGGHAPAEQVAGALLLYRGIYYLLPLGLAMLMLAAFELRMGAAAPAVRAAARLSPLFMAVLAMAAGTMLMLSGVTPSTDEAAELLALHVPLPLVEASHLLGSVTGIALVFVARGLLDRLDAAWWAAVALTLLGGALALPKGVAVWEMPVLGFALAILLLSRGEFERRASLFAQPFSVGWSIALACLVAAMLWVLLFSYHDVQYTHELWWQFEFDAHAPRSLRAATAVALLAFAWSLWQLLRPTAGRAAKPTSEDLERAASVVRAQDSAEANLALMGDKSFLFSTSGKAFLMYGKRGRSWVALHDPIGPAKEHPELIWRFMEQAAAHGGRASFYQVRPQVLSLYLDAGLRLLKLGEEAYVPLADFSLKGSHRAGLRQSVNRAEREGVSFEIVSLEQLRPIMPELKAISDAWLTVHNTREKGFSLGVFDEAYVLRNPVALIRATGRIVAFATLMRTDTRIEGSVDLMRHLPDAPHVAMDFLFARLMLYFQTEGFERFGLGMAPLSGMAEHPLAPRWHRFGRLLYAHGEHFYNFQGLRAFKEKFDPVWEPRYLATPGGLSPFIVLADVAALISGGLRGVFGK